MLYIKYMTWNPDYILEFRRRRRIVNMMLDDSKMRQALLKHYEESPVSFINDFCITYNPRNSGIKTVPFMLFERQEEFIHFLHECIIDKESGLVEKCRDIGATWLCCAFSVWIWIFKDGAVGWGSRKEQLVDRIGDPDSIFEKIRMIIRNLPPLILPKGFDISKHATYMKIINPETGATIVGEAGDNIGRGGRSTIYFKDESAHYEHPELIEAALGDNTDVQIDISSVNGTGNVFYRRRIAGEEWKLGKKCKKSKTRVFIFDWRDHPLKDQEWYDNRRKKAESEGLLHLFAQEVDRDYTSAVQGIIIPPKWVKAAIDAHIKLNFEANGEKCAGQDVAYEGGDKHALSIRHGVILQYCEDWGEGDGGDAARLAIPICKERGVNELYYDSIGVGAAFKTESNRLNPEGLRIQPWNAAAGPLDPEDNIILGDRDTPLNKDFFVNLKIQSWWRLRNRFEKTYKAVTQGIIYPSDELISLPSTLENIHEIERQLSQPVYKHNTVGKLLVDKKPDGTLSPNLADSIVICYNPTRELSILDVLW